jgi:hypothetical protein
MSYLPVLQSTLVAKLDVPEANLSFVVEQSRQGTFIDTHTLGVYDQGRRLGTLRYWDGITFQSWMYTGAHPNEPDRVVRVEGHLVRPRDPATYMERFAKGLERMAEQRRLA